MNTPIERKSQERELTATSYAVLSLLAIRDHSTYDLTKQMRLSLHYMWPRAESNVYAEPKRLVAAGLASDREEWNGSRRRTMYSITPEGRTRLSNWLAEPSPSPRYESEALLKVFFAENGTRDNLIAAIRSIRDDSTRALEHFQRVVDPYERGEGQHPWRFALSGLAIRVLAEQFATTMRWAAWAEQVVSDWDSSSIEDVEWGVATMRAVGDGFPLDDDPVRETFGVADSGMGERPSTRRRGPSDSERPHGHESRAS